MIFALRLLCTYSKSLRIRSQPISIVTIVIVRVAVVVDIAPIIAIAGVVIGGVEYDLVYKYHFGKLA